MSLAVLHRADRLRDHEEPEGSPAFLRTISPVMKIPKDDLGRDIVFLLTDHPDLQNHFGMPDLGSMTVEEKAGLLASMKAKLGIQPLRSRRLPYVGPNPTSRGNRARRRHG